MKMSLKKGKRCKDSKAKVFVLKYEIDEQNFRKNWIATVATVTSDEKNDETHTYFYWPKSNNRTPIKTHKMGFIYINFILL